VRVRIEGDPRSPGRSARCFNPSEAVESLYRIRVPEDGAQRFASTRQPARRRLRASTEQARQAYQVQVYHD
jgi:hypothetical protein